MRPFKYTTMLVLCVTLAGCSVPASKTVDEPALEVPQQVYKEAEENRTIKFSDIKAENTQEDKGTGDQKGSVDKAEDKDNVKSEGINGGNAVSEGGTPVVVQPEPRTASGEKLDFAALNKLDNTRYSWWIKQNQEHKTPGIPDVARRQTDAYDGIYIGDTDKKAVYLTFDEGYENGYTAKILDTLKENDVKAIFFVTGPYIDKQTELVKRMLDEGHQVGNHSITHPSLPEASLADLEKELWGLEKNFSEKYGKGFKYMRPPRGEYSERTMAAAKQLGYKTVFWSFAYRDFEVDNQKGADYAYDMVMKNLHNGAVFLLHAVSRDNAEALDRIIKDIRAQGYSINPFDL